MHDAGAGDFVSIGRREDDPGLTVVDRIERRQYRLATPDPVTPRPADPGGFRYPVDTAAVVETSRFELPNTIVVFVRDEDGEMVGQVGNTGEETFPPGSHEIELTPAIKIYLRANSSVRIDSTTERTRIEFGGKSRVAVGARSHHRNPAAKVTTTADPEDTMRAVSTFGSALKTLSPERSFPTLRGHPPAVELGDELDVPSALEVPDAGIRIEVPRDHGAVYTVAPLAYYFGAEVVPGDEPRLVTNRGFEFSLGPDLESTAERTLKRSFLFDCATRTEGYYEVDLRERRVVEEAVDLDFASLYDRPIADRVEAHLGTPLDDLTELLGRWNVVAHVVPTPENVESLPFLLDDLGIVKTGDGDALGVDVSSSDSFDASTIEAFTRGITGDKTQLVRPPETDSREQAWVGEGIPLGANKATPTGFRNRLTRDPTDGGIDVTVVCNDARMQEEQSVVGYGAHDTLPFDVGIRNDLTCGELREVLASSLDFVHYVGHVHDDGFECTDGRLDATELDAVGVDSFLLNACHSYDQGMGLIDAGAIGGIVTLDEIVNGGAVRIGETIARLLDAGFPLGGALDVARTAEPLGGQYLVVGDSRLTVSQFPGGTAHATTVERTEGGFRLWIHTYPIPDRGSGAMFTPELPDHDRFYLNFGRLGPFEVPRADLQEYLSAGRGVFFLDGDLHWSEDVDVGAI